MTHDDTPRTSHTHPLYVDEVPAALLRSLGAAGRLGLTLLPGKHGRAQLTGGAHARDLGVDLDRLAAAYAGAAVVSLVEDHEYEEWRVGTRDSYGAALRARGLTLLAFPVPDLGVPAAARSDAWRELVQDVARRVRAGEAVIAHCLGGLGRSGMLVACVLVELGLSADDAVRVTRAARRGAIQTPEQEHEVRRHAARLAG